MRNGFIGPEMGSIPGREFEALAGLNERGVAFFGRPLTKWGVALTAVWLTACASNSPVHPSVTVPEVSPIPLAPSATIQPEATALQCQPPGTITYVDGKTKRVTWQELTKDHSYEIKKGVALNFRIDPEDHQLKVDILNTTEDLYSWPSRPYEDQGGSVSAFHFGFSPFAATGSFYFFVCGGKVHISENFKNSIYQIPTPVEDTGFLKPVSLLISRAVRPKLGGRG